MECISEKIPIDMLKLALMYNGVVKDICERW